MAKHLSEALEKDDPTPSGSITKDSNGGAVSDHFSLVGQGHVELKTKPESAADHGSEGLEKTHPNPILSAENVGSSLEDPVSQVSRPSTSRLEDDVDYIEMKNIDVEPEEKHHKKKKLLRKNPLPHDEKSESMIPSKFFERKKRNQKKVLGDYLKWLKLDKVGLFIFSCVSYITFGTIYLVVVVKLLKNFTNTRNHLEEHVYIGTLICISATSFGAFVLTGVMGLYHSTFIKYHLSLVNIVVFRFFLLVTVLALSIMDLATEKSTNLKDQLITVVAAGTFDATLTVTRWAWAVAKHLKKVKERTLKPTIRKISGPFKIDKSIPAPIRRTDSFDVFEPRSATSVPPISESRVPTVIATEDLKALTPLPSNAV